MNGTRPDRKKSFVGRYALSVYFGVFITTMVSVKVLDGMLHDTLTSPGSRCTLSTPTLCYSSSNRRSITLVRMVDRGACRRQRLLDDQSRSELHMFSRHKISVFSCCFPTILANGHRHALWQGAEAADKSGLLVTCPMQTSTSIQSLSIKSLQPLSEHIASTTDFVAWLYPQAPKGTLRCKQKDLVDFPAGMTLSDLQ